MSYYTHVYICLHILIHTIARTLYNGGFSMLFFNVLMELHLQLACLSAALLLLIFFKLFFYLLHWTQDLCLMSTSSTTEPCPQLSKPLKYIISWVGEIDQKLRTCNGPWLNFQHPFGRFSSPRSDDLFWVLWLWIFMWPICIYRSQYLLVCAYTIFI